METLPNNQRILALDVGKKHIGVAVSDENQTIASPLTTINHKKFTETAIIVEHLMEEEGACALVIGLPFEMDGSENRMCQSIRQFARNLQKEFEVEIVFEDESYTSDEVDAAMLEGDLSRQKRKAKKDMLAAAVILQRFLDRR